MAMMAMTTSSSISVNAWGRRTNRVMDEDSAMEWKKVVLYGEK
jgi:hypothetical protein